MTLSISDVSSFMDAVFYSVVIIWYLIYLTDTNIK